MTFISQATIELNASASRVWKALTDPKEVKQYLFGTDMETSWKVGSPIIYRGEWEGKKYEDKGVVLKFEKEKLLSASYWSSMAGLEDKPENYQIVTYVLTPHENSTTLTIIQENTISQDSADHSANNWKMVLDAMKKIVEA